MFGGGTFSDMSRHPDKVVRVVDTPVQLQARISSSLALGKGKHLA
jgi:muramidase (phage lysozyme)